MAGQKKKEIDRSIYLDGSIDLIIKSSRTLLRKLREIDQSIYIDWSIDLILGDVSECAKILQSWSIDWSQQIDRKSHPHLHSTHATAYTKAQLKRKPRRYDPVTLNTSVEALNNWDIFFVMLYFTANQI